MKNILLSILGVLMVVGLAQAQTTADFENLYPGENSFEANAGPTGLFTSGNFSVRNNYNEQGMFWSGFSVSSTTDTSTRGWGNQYSCIKGEGAQGSATYLTAYAFDPAKAYTINEASGGIIDGFSINNSTYAYFSMLEGDGIAKRFGGVNGSDPDFFLLTIEAFENGILKSEKVEFYLADYRFDDAEEDYIVSDWTWVDLKSLGNVDSLLFSLSSSDNGDFGMNTPAYFCLDELVTSDVSSVSENALISDFNIYPNPSTNYIQLTTEETGDKGITIFNEMGLSVKSVSFKEQKKELKVQNLAPGIYYVNLKTVNGTASKQIRVVH